MIQRNIFEVGVITFDICRLWCVPAMRSTVLPDQLTQAPPLLQHKVCVVSLSVYIAGNPLSFALNPQACCVLVWMECGSWRRRYVCIFNEQRVWGGLMWGARGEPIDVIGRRTGGCPWPLKCRSCFKKRHQSDRGVNL